MYYFNVIARDKTSKSLKKKKKKNKNLMKGSRRKDKFLSSNIAKVWDDGPAGGSSGQLKRSREDDDEAHLDQMRITREELAEIAARRQGKSERSLLKEFLDGNKGKNMNYKMLQERKKQLKHLESEQAERDVELGGGKAIIRRTKEKKKKDRGRSLNISSGGRFVDGVLNVSHKTIRRNKSGKHHISLD